MKPLSALPSISVEASSESAVNLAREKGYRRLLVTEHSVTNVVGILSITPWQMMDEEFARNPLRSNMTEPVRLDQSQALDEVFPLLWSTSKRALGGVVDETDVAIGVVSVEDIVGEILGPIAVDEATIDRATVTTL